VAAGRFRRRSELLDEGRRSRELAREQVHRDALAEGKLEITQSSGLTGQANVPLGEHVPSLVVPRCTDTTPASHPQRRSVPAGMSVPNAHCASRSVGTAAS